MNPLGMSIGKQLLDLAEEYRLAKEACTFAMGEPVGRNPSLIADEYEEVLASLLCRPLERR